MKSNHQVGILLSIIGCALIAWGIKDTIYSEARLEKLFDKIKKIDAERPDSYYNRKLVSATCTPHNITEQSGAVLSHLKLQNVVEVQMTVEIYQWVERVYSSSDKHETKTYYYEREWRYGYVSTLGWDRYHHQRDRIVDLHSKTFHPKASHIGCSGLRLDADIVRQALPNKHINPKLHFNHDNHHWLTNGQQAKVRFADEYVYITMRDMELESGDIRVSFTYKALEGDKLSVVGQLDDNYIRQYKDDVIGNIHMVQLGEINRHTLLEKATASWFSYYMYILGGIINMVALGIILR